MAKVVVSGFLILVLHLVITDALQCLSCDNVPEARDCRRLVTCGSHEICFVQRNIASNLKQYYKLGCTDKNVCLQEQDSMFAMGKRDTSRRYSAVRESRDIQTRGKVARASDDDMTLCLQCCESTDGCNKDLCGSAPTSNLRCLTCNDVMNPKDCEQLSECSRDEYCYVHKGLNPHIASYEVRHDMGCMGLLQCNAFKAIYPKSCVKCCNQTDLCNYAACDGWTPAPTPPASSHMTVRPTTRAPTTTTIPVPTTVAPQVIINGPDKGNYMSQANLSCVTVPPAQSYYWKFNGVLTLPQSVVTQQSVTSAGTVAGVDTLAISKLTETTFGTYTCVASINGHTLEQSHAISIVEEPPTVHIQVPPIANSFAMQCNTTGYPVPHIEWDFMPSGVGSHGIPPGVQFNDQGFLSTLFVNVYRPTDHNGIWYCKAKNSQGSAIASVKIP